MSWIQKLADTYDYCTERHAENVDSLVPVCHTTQQAHIEIVLDDQGNFRRASVLDKSSATTLIPCTEDSGGRAGSKPVNHPLCDKLQYIAGDYLDFGGEVTSGFSGVPEEPHREYQEMLRAWVSSEYCHPKIKAVYNYINKKRVITDLLASRVLHADERGKLLKKWEGDKASAPQVFKVLSPSQNQDSAFVRWRVEELGNPVSGTWQDEELVTAWIAYYQTLQNKYGYCMVSGEKKALAIQHPAKLRHGGDKAKLISSNDIAGYTFRGRFIESDEAASVSFLVTQKAHSALRWLIAHQGYKNGEQAIVSWAVNGTPVPNPFVNTLELFGIVGESELVPFADTGQTFAVKLTKVISGYSASLKPGDDVVVMAIDSATPGRMAITFYRELNGSEFLERIKNWHSRYAWIQNFGKENNFIGAPAPREIAEAAYGRRLDEKLRKSIVERLLPCVIDEQRMPRDLLESVVRRASNRSGQEAWEWEKCLGIACALYRGHHLDRRYQMPLEEDRISRDYLYGRLLAIADSIEGYALFLAGENRKRETSAARMMQRFADRPFSTWRNIELSLVPYKSRLQAGSNKASAFLARRNGQLDEVMTLLDSVADRTSDSPLTGEFLLGFHSQRQSFKPKDALSVESEEAVEDSIS